jgi:hypothetical protein
MSTITELPIDQWPDQPSELWPALPPVDRPDLVNAADRRLLAERRIARDDMRDDLQDGSELGAWPRLASLLAPLNGPLREHYEQWNAAALKKQAGHSFIVWIAAVSGLLAISMAIVQLGYPHSYVPADKIEIATAAVAFFSIVMGLIAAFSQQWRLRRLQAEQCRIAKFGLLLSAEYYSTHPQAFAADLEVDINCIRALTPNTDDANSSKHAENTCHDWILRRVNAVRLRRPHGGDLNEAFVDQLVEYLLRKRLRYQAQYFKTKYSQHHWKEESSWRVPAVLVLASLVCAIAHFALEIPLHHWDAPEESIWWNVSKAILFMAAFLPAMAAFFRTVRGAHEYGRNANRYYAMWIQLYELEKELQKRKAARDLPGQLDILREVEVALESEHRSWMRLMVETEWI